MPKYKRILLALELNYGAESFVIEKTKQLAQGEKAQVFLVHAIENVGNYGASYAASAGVDLEHALMLEAAEKLQPAAKALKVKKENQFIEKGIASQVVLSLAEKLQPDLIIVGSHGKHGLSLLLGSTANAVIHSSKIDVLAVRAPKK